MVSKMVYKEHLQVRQLFQHPWAQIILLLIFCSLLFILGVGRWDLWNPDEPRYAQVAKEMATRGDWILMHVNGGTYVDKPPLFFWLIALSSFLWQGFTSFSARFPSGFFQHPYGPSHFLSREKSSMAHGPDSSRR